ncbi:dihydrodipicolinate synthase family protein [Pedobacter sp. MC2016-14]|uniref:dihydrodipicolinate synthase family protein n=1 Tax=Pedobacter sp. MC2016-14 TaxID=2897327 RepID=UPI001E56FABA|nr:dihydrodipicolinate synthase family protein [Pedobacter sp. MC2016-14]MCD0489529.1 dihydrodipicolinate synthase family protein [Pedobacter sp. MC2016-14]
MGIKWAGVFPAITTKFTSEEELDLDACNKGLEAQLEAGVDGIVIGGSLGEASTLSEEEKFILLKETVKTVAGRVPVVFSIAEQATRVAVAQAIKAEELGASGIMLLPPLRYYASADETIAYFAAVAESTSLDMMIYNNPVDYKIHVTLDMFAELEQYSNITAVKESTRDISNITRMINRFGERYKLFTGVDPLALESIVAGAQGWVAGLVDAFPKETVAIFRLVKAGRIEEAVAINRWFMPLLDLDIHPKLVQYIKLAEVATGTGTENVRAPRLKLVGKEREQILKVINDALAVRPTLPEGSWGILEAQAV